MNQDPFPTYEKFVLHVCLGNSLKNYRKHCLVLDNFPTVKKRSICWRRGLDVFWERKKVFGSPLSLICICRLMNDAILEMSIFKAI